jgi:hypothetical protein
MSPRILAYCALSLILALYVVGFVSHGILRHLVQTAPVWPIVILGWKGSKYTQWMALACFLFWLFLMSLIWLFLLGWSHVISGTFSPIEIAMTLVVGGAAILGIIVALRARTSVRALVAMASFVVFLLIQFCAVRISFLPRIAHD